MKNSYDTHKKTTEWHDLSSKRSSTNNLIYSNMKGETLPPSEAKQAASIETAPSKSVTDFILHSLDIDLQAEIQKLPTLSRNKASRLAKKFQEDFIGLIADNARNITLTEIQMSFLRAAIVGGLTFTANSYEGEVTLFKNNSDLLITATYINSLKA